MTLTQRDRHGGPLPSGHRRQAQGGADLVPGVLLVEPQVGGGVDHGGDRVLLQARQHRYQ